MIKSRGGGGGREGHASCMAELKDVDEALVGKPARQGHSSDMLG